MEAELGRGWEGEGVVVGGGRDHSPDAIGCSVHFAPSLSLARSLVHFLSLFLFLGRGALFASLVVKPSSAGVLFLLLCLSLMEERCVVEEFRFSRFCPSLPLPRPLPFPPFPKAAIWLPVGCAFSWDSRRGETSFQIWHEL